MLNVLHAALGMAKVKEDQLAGVTAEKYAGAEGWAVIKSTLEETIDEVTGEKVLNPFTQKPMFRYQRNITEFVAPEAESQQF
jgi:hypothetical protein